MLVEQIVNSEYANIAVVILRQEAELQRNVPDTGKVRWQRFLFDVYANLDRKLFDVQPNALQRRDMAGLLAAIPKIDAKPMRIEIVDTFPEPEILAIENLDLDVMVTLSDGIPVGAILASARYGMWAFRYGDRNSNRRSPPGFREVMEDGTVTESSLEILADDPNAGRVLCRSFSQSDKRSMHRNMNKVYWKSLSFLPRMLEKLAREGPVEFFKEIDRQYPFEDDYPSGRAAMVVPSNWSMIKLAAILAFRLIRDKFNALIYFEQWIVLFGINDGPTTSFSNFKKLVPSKDRAIADPFVLRNDDAYYIFAEEIDRTTNKGHLSVLVMDAQGKVGPPTTIIDRPYHLSYPHVFEHDGQYYLVPESSAEQTIQLYRCTEFPYQWEFQMNLMENIKAVDTTLLYHRNKWWLFANVVENPGASSYDELFLFHAETLFTTSWTAHALNPVISDVRRARPAGRIFLKGDTLFRPSQNNAKRYGHGFQLNEIKTLSEHDYEEVPGEYFVPDWDDRLLAMHTFNSCGDLTVIDAVLRRRRLFESFASDNQAHYLPETTSESKT